MKLAVIACMLLTNISMLGIEPIHTNPRLFVVSGDGDYVVLEGSWRRVSKRESTEVPSVNSFRVECWRKDKVCREYTAKLFRPSDYPSDMLVRRTSLFVQVQEFAVEAWDHTGIVAKARPRAADIVMHVLFGSRDAVRTSQETEARGAVGARASEDRWVFN